MLNILENFPKSRDSDQWLTIKLWCVYYPTRIQEEGLPVPEGEKPIVRKFVYLDDIMELPREDNIKRMRAIIQNEEHLFLPTSWEVAKQRQIAEWDWQEYTRKSNQPKVE